MMTLLGDFMHEILCRDSPDRAIDRARLLGFGALEQEFWRCPFS
jgi:hypothetical protein